MLHLRSQRAPPFLPEYNCRVGEVIQCLKNAMLTPSPGTTSAQLLFKPMSECECGILLSEYLWSLPWLWKLQPVATQTRWRRISVGSRTQLCGCISERITSTPTLHPDRHASVTTSVRDADPTQRRKPYPSWRLSMTPTVTHVLTVHKWDGGLALLMQHGHPLPCQR